LSLPGLTRQSSQRPTPGLPMDAPVEPAHDNQTLAPATVSQPLPLNRTAVETRPG
jgi:hypothetical protein